MLCDKRSSEIASNFIDRHVDYILIHGKPDQESVLKCSLSVLPILASKSN